MSYKGDPIALWIFARLFDSSINMGRRDLLKNLCQASFDTMNEVSDFDKGLELLVTDGLISSSKLGGEAHYNITEKGIITFRKDLVKTVLDSVKKVENNPGLFTKYKGIVESIKNTVEVVAAV